MTDEDAKTTDRLEAARILRERGRRERTAHACRAVGTPKNRERRDVDLISDVVALLARMRGEGENRGAGESLGFHLEEKCGFLSPTIVLRRQLYPAMVAAGIPRVGPTQEKRTRPKQSVGSTIPKGV